MSSRAQAIFSALGQGSSMARNQRLRDKEKTENFLVQEMQRKNALMEAQSGKQGLEQFKHGLKMKEIEAGSDAYRSNEGARLKTNKQLQDEEYQYKKELKELELGAKKADANTGRARIAQEKQNTLDKYDQALAEYDVKMNDRTIKPGSNQYNAYKRQFDVLVKKRNAFAKKHKLDYYEVDPNTMQPILKPGADEKKRIEELAKNYYSMFGNNGFNDEADLADFERLLKKFPEHVALNKIKANLEAQQGAKKEEPIDIDSLFD